MSLIRDVHENPTKQKIIRSMVRLCHDMGKRIIAEGVEQREERDALVELGCDLLQGYLFARPGKPFPAAASLA
jgi:EAL domain-containing protein (putative c-di-GMP-specific phosphodiesterase class I)